MAHGITVVEHPAKRLVGLFTRTSMARAREDCPEVWERLMTPVTALAGAHAYDGYGVSADCAADTGFTYWAALDAPLDKLREVSWVGMGAPVVPFRIEGLATFDLRAGQYAMVSVPSMEALPESYRYLYGAWSEEEKGYVPDTSSACFEFYPKTWREGEPFRLYVPVTKNR